MDSFLYVMQKYKNSNIRQERTDTNQQPNSSLPSNNIKTQQNDSIKN